MVIVLVISNQYREENLERLADFRGNIYLNFDYIMGKPEELLDFVQSVDLAREENKKIYLYSNKEYALKTDRGDVEHIWN